MSRLLALGLFAFLSTASATPVPDQHALIDADFPDPMVLHARDGFYYAYSTGSTDRGTPQNLSVARSRDQERWSAPIDALPDKPSWAQKKSNFWAPHVVETATDYVLFYSAEPDWSESEHMRLGVARSPSPVGPFRDIGAPLDTGDAEENIDPMAFIDPHGGPPLLYWGRNGVIVVQPLAPSLDAFAAGTQPQELLGPSDRPYESVTEAPYVTSKNGYYYLYYSGDDCCEKPHYAVSVARSKSPLGPFERGGLLVEASPRWLAPGHCSVFEESDGHEWIYFHAVDPANPRIPSGERIRRPFLRASLSYRDGWPSLMF